MRLQRLESKMEEGISKQLERWNTHRAEDHSAVYSRREGLHLQLKEEMTLMRVPMNYLINANKDCNCRCRGEEKEQNSVNRSQTRGPLKDSKPKVPRRKRHPKRRREARQPPDDGYGSPVTPVERSISLMPWRCTSQHDKSSGKRWSGGGGRPTHEPQQSQAGISTNQRYPRGGNTRESTSLGRKADEPAQTRPQDLRSLEEEELQARKDIKKNLVVRGWKLEEGPKALRITPVIDRIVVVKGVIIVQLKTSATS